MELTDVQIIEKCLAGDSEIFEELINRYKKLIYSVVYNLINNKEEVNDIAQEVFIRIYKALNRYNPEYKFSTWSVKITTNFCLDILRKRRVSSVPMEEAIGVADSVDTPEEAYIKSEQREKIKKAIVSLPEKYRIPIILFHKNGLSYDEITKILNEPLSIVKNRLYRARLMLKDKLLSERKEEVL